MLEGLSMRKGQMKGFLLGFGLCLIPVVLLAQEGLSKYERIVELEKRLSKLEKEVAEIKSKMTTIEWPSS